MTRGFLLGKFLPPHEGHVFLGQFARYHCDRLTILVCSLDREPIPGGLRYRWMSELFPDCRVIHMSDDVPQEPSEHPDFWTIWREIIKRVHPEAIDYVYASEPYGARLAKELHAEFVPVDLSRLAVPVSGRAIRQDPFAHWQFIPAPVRPYFAKKVCLFGPESSGKTTLANWLAKHFNTIAVPEYGRVYTDQFGTELPPEAFLKIARGHQAATEAAARVCNRILILDTDPALTAVWAEMLLGTRIDVLDSWPNQADLYLLTDVDIPWEDDGTRYFRDPERRHEFFRLCQKELERRNLPFVTLKGDFEQRKRAAARAILERFPGLPPSP